MPLRKTFTAFAVLFWICATQALAYADAATADKFTVATHSGFFDLAWDEAHGKLFLHVPVTGMPFIYQTSLARGIGSNDLGADRGRLGETRLVEFFRSGSRLLLIENNTTYRANSPNADERQAVRESFARSVLWGFTIEHIEGDVLIVDATDFFLRDALAMGQWLANQQQGNFSVDNSRSAIYLPRTRSFTDNTEIEAILTLTGTPKGDILRTVVPDPSAITIHIHHSFIRLPDEHYEPLDYDPRSGFLDPEYGGSFVDYAVPVNASVAKAYVRRHRLRKLNPDAAVSAAVKPIVYYLDRGVPEPVRGALLDGARWWDQAFAAAGYKDAFQVELLPEKADPMDVRYNVIQWVHRSTRGWSYGASVIDPRTGEIIKGHVSLGSLRVRQDFLLAEGLLAPYANGNDNPALEAFALARIRQLSAHEVGHTLGLEHNFAGSVNNRASVMDYPFPLITLTNGVIDVSDAYATGIGDWDKRAILWGYQDFPESVNAREAREEIIAVTYNSGLKYVADNDSRSVGSAHVDGSLWDNGADPVSELQKLRRVRRQVLENFSSANIQTGRPLATLEEVLVPMYLLHRYQIQAVGKLIGGGYYTYNLKGDGQSGFVPVAQNQQHLALNELLELLEPEELLLPETLSALISPRPPGFPKGRETFARSTGLLFDRFAPAQAAVALILDVLLNPARAARLSAPGGAQPQQVTFDKLVGRLIDVTGFTGKRGHGESDEIRRRTFNQVVERLIAMAADPAVSDSARGIVLLHLEQLQTKLGKMKTRGSSNEWRAHDTLIKRRLSLALENPDQFPPLSNPEPPPGSPIGTH